MNKKVKKKIQKAKTQFKNKILLPHLPSKVNINKSAKINQVKWVSHFVNWPLFYYK